MLQTKRGIAWLLSVAMLFGMLSYGRLPAMAEELPAAAEEWAATEAPTFIPEATDPAATEAPTFIPEATDPAATEAPTFIPEATVPATEEPTPVPTEAPVPPVVEDPEEENGEMYITEFQDSCSGTVYAKPGSAARLYFTPEEGGMYVLETDSLHTCSITDDKGSVVAVQEGGKPLTCQLEQGVAYTVTIEAAWESWVSYTLTLHRSISLGQSTQVEIQRYDQAAWFAFVPETDGAYLVSLAAKDGWVRVEVTDPAGNRMVRSAGDARVTAKTVLQAGVRYTLQVQYGFGDHLGTIRVELAQAETLPQGETVQAQPGDDLEINYLVTPEETGYYLFQALQQNSYVEIELFDGTGINLDGSGGHAAAFCQHLIGGRSYIFTVRFKSDGQSGGAPVCYTRVPQLQPGQSISVPLGGENANALSLICPEITDSYTLSWESGHYLGAWLYAAGGDQGSITYGTTGSKTMLMEAGKEYLAWLKLPFQGGDGETTLSITQSHDYEDAEETPPTCTQEGQLQFTCIHCGEEITRILPAEHSYEDGSCAVCGQRYICSLVLGYNHYGPGVGGWATKKAYYSFTPTQTGSYSFRGTSDTDTLAKLYDDQGTELAFCDDANHANPDFAITARLEAGKTVYLVVERFVGGTLNGAGVELSLEHDFEVETVPATCEENGQRISTCTLCGYRIQETLYGGHDWDGGDKDLPCNQEAEVTYTCRRCGETRTELQRGEQHWYNNGSATCDTCGRVMNDGESTGPLTWSVDPSQTLTISCNGNMPDYNDTAAPWAPYMGGIRRVVVEEGTTSIGGASFRNAFALEQISLPESLERIEMYAFRNSGIQSITIPAGVREIQIGAFADCYALTGLQIHPDNETLRSEGRAILSKDGKVLHGVAGAVNGAFTIPDGVEELVWGAFSGCHIEYLTVPDSVQRIQQFAFYEFGGSDSVVRFLGDAPKFSAVAFAGPEDWEALACKVCYPKDNPTWESVITETFGGYPQWEGWETQVLSGTCGKDLRWTLDEAGTLTVTGTGAMADYGYYALDTNEYIYAPWYDYRNQIRNVVLEPGVTSIGEAAFRYCYAMESVQIPDTVTRINGSAFYECFGLRSVSLPDSVTKFRGHGIFMQCTSLESIRLPSGMTTIPEAMFVGCRSLKQIDLPDSLTEIMASAFQNCTALESVVIPEGCVSLSSSVFRECTALKQVTLPRSLMSIGHRAFAGCRALTNVSLPENLTAMGSAAFENCRSLQAIDLPDSLQKIGWGAFTGCQGLTEVTVPQGIGYLGGTFWNCFNLKTVNIPDTVTGIGYWTFRNCTSLQTLALPEQLQALGDAVFADSGVTSLEFSGDAPVFTLPGGTRGGAYSLSLTGDSLLALELPETLAEARSRISAYGDSVGTFAHLSAEARYPGQVPSWTEAVLTGDYGGSITWVPGEPIANRVYLPAEQLSGCDNVWVDGIECPVHPLYTNCYVELPEGAKTMTAYEFCLGDIHTTYPTAMKVWLLEENQGQYAAVPMPELEDLLRYEGMSIRITGKQGIRMITSVDKALKKTLTTKGLNGFTLREYGTVVAWAEALGETGSLTLGEPNTKSAYAYRKAVADPIFAQDETRVQYTNVLVNFQPHHYAKDLVLRPYMILEDEAGKEYTLYGGTLCRSIASVAWQNRNAFPTGSEAWAYVWNIIKDAYGVEPAAVEYTVTALDYFDAPVSGIPLCFLQEGAAVAEAVTDDRGQVTVTLPEGTYEIAVPEDMYTDKTKAVVTVQQPSVHIRVIAGVSGEEGEIYGIPIPILKEGATYVQWLQSNTDNYFLFVPEEAGRYRFQGAVSDAVLNYWGNNTNFLMNKTDSTDYDPDTNAFTLNIKPTNLGTSYVLGLTGDSWGVLVIERIGDHTLDIADMVAEPYKAVNSIERDFSLESPAGQQLTYIDVFGETVTCHKGADGYYHLNSETGPVLYVNLGESAPYLPMSDCMGVTDEYAVYNLEYVYYDESGTPLRKESYNECMREYVLARCEKTDLYPLNEDLIFMFRQANAVKGWGELSSPDYLFYDSNWEKLTGVNAEIAWMYAVCYLS